MRLQLRGQRVFVSYAHWVQVCVRVCVCVCCVCVYLRPCARMCVYLRMRVCHSHSSRSFALNHFTRPNEFSIQPWAGGVSNHLTLADRLLEVRVPDEVPALANEVCDVACDV